MIPTAQETSEESFKREKPAEGWEGVKLRDAPDPETRAGTMDSVTDRHVAPTSPQESDSETRVFLRPVPSPPSGVTGTCPMSFGDTNDLETCSSPVSESPEATSTSPKKKDFGPGISPRKRTTNSSPDRSSNNRKKSRESSTDCSRRKIKRVPPTNPEDVTDQNNDVWVFLNIKNKNEVSTINISKENILEYIKENYIYNKKTKQEETLNTKKYTFLKMIINNTLIKNKFKELMDNKDRQQAIAVFIRTNNEIEVIGPFESKRKKGIHSEDLIIDKMNMFLNDNNDVSEIWIYTVNNPCLGRKKHTPCMYDLIQFSKAHGHINIYIGFSKYYIFIKDPCKFFKNLEDSAQKCKVVNQTGSETLEELQFTLREEIKENCEEDLEIKPANSQCPALKLDEDFTCDFVGFLEDLNLEIFMVHYEELLKYFASEE